MFNSTEPGIYLVKALVKAENPSKITIQVGDQEIEALISETNGEFANTNLGEIEISETGELILTMRPVQEEWTGIELGQVVLVKQ